jgi:hypothetical protein
MVSDALLRFQKEVCPEISLDNPEITDRLIDEINHLRRQVSKT